MKRHLQLFTGNRAIRLVAVVVFALAGVLTTASMRPPVHKPAPVVQTAPPAGTDFAKFSHRSYSHSQLACASCHQRSDNSITPKFPGHSACTNCHLSQFVNPAAPMCTLCHENLSSMPPPMKAFPTKFSESFNVKFDHAQHNQGAGRPANGCATCHSGARRGTAMSILSGIAAHTTCYACHSPGARSGAGADISGCASCHSAASFRRTSTNGPSFSVGFSHATHGARQRLNCSDCHSLAGGRPQGQQASSPRALEHFAPVRGSSCATCHNGKRAFGELSDCKKCHTGATFAFRGR
jgi:c(7)-type cytochrome triheme protein